MTEKENYKISEMKLEKFAEDDWKCQFPKCNKRALYLAHRISKSKVNIRLYGLSVIHDKRNFVSVCENGNHNDYFNIGFNNQKTLKLVSAIKQNREIANSQEVEDFLNGK